MMAFFDLAGLSPVPWKNGGGSTQELVCWPPGAGMDGFEWRVSVATIATPGPFSAFPGVDRQIMLLGGDGVHLQGAGGCWAHALDQRWRPFAFSGEEPVDCSMLGSTSTDFNLMLRRGAWHGTLQVVRDAQPLAHAPAGLCMVLQGTWFFRSDGATSRALTAGQGAWWVHGPVEAKANGNGAQGGEGAVASPRVEPLGGHGSVRQQDAADPVLAFVALQLARSIEI